MKDRILLPDIARTFSVLWIVIFLHIFDYIEQCYRIDNIVFLTYGALGCFTFLSGLFLGKKKVSIKNFYKSRLERILPLLIIPALLIAKNIKQAIFTVTGLSCFIPPQPHTLWYISMLIVFYIATPILLYRLNIFEIKEDKIKFIVRSGFFFLLIVLLYIFFSADYRVLVYYPLYVIGILTPISLLPKIKKLFVFFIIVGIIFTVIGRGINIRIISQMIQAIGLSMIILAISSVLEKIMKGKAKIIIEFISYSSMTLYLYHRVVYGLFKRIYGAVYLSWWQVISMIIVLFIVAYYSQRGYDYILKRYKERGEQNKNRL